MPKGPTANEKRTNIACWLRKMPKVLAIRMSAGSL